MDEPAEHATEKTLLEPGEFRLFYDEALPVVYGYFLRRCGGRVDVAEDLTQQTFASALAGLRAGTEVAAPLPWVVAIARRRLVDHWRAETSWRRRLDAGRRMSAGAFAPDLPEPELAVALGRVSSEHRTALVLRYVDDLSVRQIAELMGRSERATESLLVRARSALADEYRELGGG
jgi:RNA polymerase sigma-70 factor (ECF subfamily)